MVRNQLLEDALKPYKWPLTQGPAHSILNSMLQELLKLMLPGFTGEPAFKPPGPPEPGPPSISTTLQASQPVDQQQAIGSSVGESTPSDASATLKAIILGTLLCPLTGDVISDPVVLTDGYTYERAAIVEWLEQQPFSPLTMEPVQPQGVRPNLAVRKLVHWAKGM
jgi:hypothetical protein